MYVYETCVLTYTYSSDHYSVVSKPPNLGNDGYSKCNAQRSTLESIVCYFLKTHCAIALLTEKLIFMCLYASSTLNFTLYFNRETN